MLGLAAPAQGATCAVMTRNDVSAPQVSEASGDLLSAATLRGTVNMSFAANRHDIVQRAATHAAGVAHARGPSRLLRVADKAYLVLIELQAYDAGRRRTNRSGTFKVNSSLKHVVSRKTCRARCERSDPFLLGTSLTARVRVG
jgi:hypothetical protein